MPKGRKPIPTAIKILQGSRLSAADKSHVTGEPGSLEPPAWIAKNKIALEHWNEVAPITKAMGTLTKSSRLALALLCDEFAYIRSVARTRSGAARDRYRRLLVEFGFTPSSLSRIKAAIEPPKDNLALFLEEHKT